MRKIQNNPALSGIGQLLAGATQGAAHARGDSTILADITQLKITEPTRFNIYLHTPLNKALLPEIKKTGLKPAGKESTLSSPYGGDGQASCYDPGSIYFGKAEFFSRESIYNGKPEEFVYVLMRHDTPPMIDNDYSKPDGQAYCYHGHATPAHRVNIDSTSVVSFTLPLSAEDATGLSRFIYKDEDHVSQAYDDVQRRYNAEFSSLSYIGRMGRDAFHFPDQRETQQESVEAVSISDNEAKASNTNYRETLSGSTDSMNRTHSEEDLFQFDL